MIEYTKPLLMKNKVKIGKQVPDNCVEICSFDNGINKTKTSNSISSSSEKTLSQTKLGKAWEIVKDRDEVNDDVFSTEKNYSDDGGYSGVVAFKSSKWVDKVRDSKEYRKLTEIKTYNSYSNVPYTLAYDVDNFIGELSLTKLDTLETYTTTQSKSSGYETKVASHSITSDTKSFPDTYSYSNNGFKGTLKLSEIVEITNELDYEMQVDTIYSKKVNGVFPTYINKDGNTYYHTGQFIDKSETKTEMIQETNKVYETKTIDTWVKHYGVCRYWGGGSSSSNNYYGDPDSRFYVGRRIAKGYMNGAATPTLHRWNHTVGKACTHKPEKYPIDCGGYWTSAQGEKSGIKWTFDIEEAAKYGGSTDKAKGGVVWASDYWKNSGGVWPPKGYENDYLGGNHLTQITHGNNRTIPHTNKLCVKAGPQKTSLAGYYNSGGWYCKWFRDVVLFYKGLTQKKITIEKDVVTEKEHIVKIVWQEGVYQSMVLKPKGVTVKYKAIYTGEVKKETFEEVSKVTGVKVQACYEGIVNKNTIKYDGKAYYEGIVYKKVFVDPTVSSENKNEIFIVDSDGYLKHITKNANFKSQYITLTNIAKNGVPLKYVAKLKNKLYIPNEIKSSYITDENIISLKYDDNLIDNIVYLTRLTPTEKSNYYNIEILTNKCIGILDNVYAYFSNKNASITKELLCTELLYTQGIDYVTEKQLDNINYRVKFGDSVTKQDTRRKINVRYKVQTLDGEFSSNERNVNVINYEYALDGEKINYLGDKMCISPNVDGELLSAKELIAYDNEIDISTLRDKKVVIKLLNNTSTVDSYTEPNGYGLLYASTYEDTGYPVTESGTTKYTGKEKSYIMLSSVDDVIYNSYYVTFENQDWLKVQEPYNTNDNKNWYSRIKYFPFELSSNRNDTNITATYAMPEYSRQNYCDLGCPYVKILEKPIIINDHTVKLSRENILFKTTNGIVDSAYFKIYCEDNGKEYTVTGFDIEKSIAVTKEILPSNKTIMAEYMYAELSYEYKGYEKHDVSYHLDLNPNVYHTYTDLDTCSEKKTYDLFNHTIYLFIKPTKVVNHDTNEVIEDNANTINLYHKIDNPEQESAYDLLIGIISPTPYSSILNTKIKSSSIYGGGIKEKYISINKDMLDGFYDINIYSEKAIQKNGTVIIKLSDQLLNEYSEKTVNKIISKHLPLGVLPIIN